MRIGIAREFVDVWDKWLQDCLPKVRAGLGPRWAQSYLTAPIWRFTLAPGVVGKSAWIGVLMPSSDRVGRQYPLTLAAQIDTRASHIEAHFIGDSTFLDMENLALSALDDDTTFDDFQHSLEGVENSPSSANVQCFLRSEQIVVVGSDRMQSRGIIAARYFSDRLKCSSLWSSDDGLSARILSVDGLPGPETLAGLFDMRDPLWSGEGAA